MINELSTSDIEVRLRSPETNYILGLFRRERGAGRDATIAMLTAEIMKAYGPHLVVLEQTEGDEFRFLYAGATIPDDQGKPVTGKLTSEVNPDTAKFYTLGCLEAGSCNDAVSINHMATQSARVHRWECLFMPMADSHSARMFVALCIPRDYKHDFLLGLLDAGPDAMVVATPVRDSHNEIVDATIIMANRRALEIGGQATAADLLGSSLGRLFGAGQSNSVLDRSMTTLKSGKPQKLEYHHRDDTSSRWFNITTTTVKDGILVTCADISEIKRTLLELEHQQKLLTDEMEQRRGLEQELWSLAHLDPLTSLPNRRAFRDSARIKLAESQTAHRPCAVITIDIDHFKRVNDAYGHGAGDTVLRRVADIIQAPLRPNTDMAARMGGEEFAIIMPDTDTDSAIAFAEKLRKRIEQTIVVVGEHEISPTVSLGVALNRKSTNLDDLLERADRALYTAKRTGRNKVCTEIDIQASEVKPAAA